MLEHREIDKLTRSDRDRGKNVPVSLSSSSLSGWARLEDLRASLIVVSVVEAVASEAVEGVTAARKGKGGDARQRACTGSVERGEGLA